MLGKKKKQKIEIPKAPEYVEEKKAPEPTPVDEVKLMSQTKADQLDWVLKEYSDLYSGIFKAGELKDIDTEATTLNLLVGIFAELRLIREKQ